MIYVCVPVHNEARTAGLVLWKVRQVFTAFPREYQLLVLDDASTDDTREVLASYAKVLPMTIVTHRERRGYAKSLEELLRLALQRTDRPKRDCAITLHADFVHSPESMEDMVKHLESGADLVVAELVEQRGQVSRALGLARRWTPRLLRIAGLRDTVSGFLALRLIVLRQALRRDTPRFLQTEGWCASAELVARLAPHARRLDAVPAAARYDLVQRPSRVRPWRQLLEAWRARSVIRAARTALALLLISVGLHAQSDTASRTDSSGTDPASFTALPAMTTIPPPVAVPFTVGERLVYGARYGPFSVGTATMRVAGIDTIRGVEAVHFVFLIDGGALWYHIHQNLESWVGRHDFRSRRFLNQTEEKGKTWERKFEIYPDSGFYREAGRDTTAPTVADPLDDAAFLYWIRTVPLEIGKRYEYRRYFRPERNPVIVDVLKRERVGVAGKKWDAIVVRPRIPNGGGIFAEKDDARMWLSDDSLRIMLALQSKFSFGQVTLKLKAISAIKEDSASHPEHPCPTTARRTLPGSRRSPSRSAPTKSTPPCSRIRPAAIRASPPSGIRSPPSSPRRTFALLPGSWRRPRVVAASSRCSAGTSSRSAWAPCFASSSAAASSRTWHSTAAPRSTTSSWRHTGERARTSPPGWRTVRSAWWRRPAAR